LALAYADPSDEDVMEDYMSYVNSLAAEYGFIPYVVDINLAYARPEEAESPLLLGQSILAMAKAIAAALSIAWSSIRRQE